MVAHLIKGHCKVKEDYSDPLQGATMSETGPEIKFNCQSLLTAFLDRKYIVVLKKIVIQIKVVAYCAPEAFKDDLT